MKYGLSRAFVTPLTSRPTTSRGNLLKVERRTNTEKAFLTPQIGELARRIQYVLYIQHVHRFVVSRLFFILVVYIKNSVHVVGQYQDGLEGRQVSSSTLCVHTRIGNAFTGVWFNSSRKAAGRERPNGHRRPTGYAYTPEYACMLRILRSIFVCTPICHGKKAVLSLANN